MCGFTDHTDVYQRAQSLPATSLPNAGSVRRHDDSIQEKSASLLSVISGAPTPPLQKEVIKWPALSHDASTH